MRGRRRDPVLDVYADFALASLIKQQRVLRVLGDAPRWDVDLDAGQARIGDARFRLDVLGTEAAADRTFVWAWANASFGAEQTLTARLLHRVGHRWEIEALIAEDALPVDRVDGHVAGVIGAGIGEADGYYVGHHSDGALVFLLRHRVLRDEPFAAHDVLTVLNMLVAGELPVDARAALEAFAGDPLPGFAVAVGEREATLDGPGGRFVLELDRRGRAARVTAGPESDRPAPDAPEPPGAELRAVGDLALDAGPVVVFDPLLAVDTMLTQPRPGALPGGVHRVAVTIDHEDGDERVATARLVLGAGRPVAWQPVGSVTADSGVCAFATPQAARRLAEDGGAAQEALERALAATASDTWRHASLDGLVAFSAGHGAGDYELAWGFDAEDRLVQVAVRMLPEPPVEDPETGEAAAPPERGLQRALLLPLAAGGWMDPANVLVLPPEAHDALTALHRRMLRASLGQAGDIDVEVLPEQVDDSPVPARITVRVAAGAASFEAAIDVQRPG